MFDPFLMPRDSVLARGPSTGESIDRAARADVQHLEQQVERLLMISEALWSFIKEHHGYSDSDLFEKVLQIDASDGKIDGKVARTPPQQCPKCQRPLPRTKPFCMYCGTAVVRDCFER